MEPNTQPKVETMTPSMPPNKNKKMLIVLIVIIVLIIVAILLRSKVIAPVNTENGATQTGSPTEQLSKDIDSATTFDNEADLEAIDKEFN